MKLFLPINHRVVKSGFREASALLVPLKPLSLKLTGQPSAAVGSELDRLPALRRRSIIGGEGNAKSDK